MHYAVYDISSNDVRSSVINILKNKGFVRIQKSVFCGNLTNQIKKDLIEEIKMVLADEDSFYLILSCNNCFGKIMIMGKGFDKDYVSDTRGSMVL